MTPAGPRAPAAPVCSAQAPLGGGLTDEQVADVMRAALADRARGERVLVLVPDATRDVPMPRLLPLALEALGGARSIQVMVALGTHPPMAPAATRRWLGLDGPGPWDRPGAPAPSITGHAWADPSALAPIGEIGEDRLRALAGPYWHQSLRGDLLVRVNRAVLEADRVVIIGPTLPHEVAGFSGGAKYLFPGVSGPEMIDVMHWLGALAGILATIGVAGTPVRALIDEAAGMVSTPVDLVALVTADSGATGTVVSGIYAGGHQAAWAASVPQAARSHIQPVARPYQRVISCAMPIYDELWTAGKAMYKLEPAVADGGELVIYAPHLSRVSVTHGPDIFDVGYHVLPYFLKHWERFSAKSLAVLAHSTHVKGAGHYDTESGRESPRITVKLATRISAEDCGRLNLGYEPLEAVTAEIVSPDEGTLVVPRSGEILFRLAE